MLGAWIEYANDRLVSMQSCVVLVILEKFYEPCAAIPVCAKHIDPAESGTAPDLS